VARICAKCGAQNPDSFIISLCQSCGASLADARIANGQATAPTADASVVAAAPAIVAPEPAVAPSVEDAAKAEELFTVLMGEEVEPRRRFIEQYAREVKNLDI